MMTKKRLPLLLIVLVGSVTVKAQENRFIQQARIDSSQRVLMKDSLQMTDVQIDTVFSIRNQHWQAIAAIRRDTAVATDRQQELFEALKLETYEAIRTTLGAILFERYTQFIVSRAQRRGNTHVTPLTGQVLSK